MKVFLSGGSGTLGKELTKLLYPTADRIVIYSRDECKHAEMRRTFPEGPPGPMRYRVGDIRDKARMMLAMSDCNVVVHAAALKRIDTCESEVYECMKTNIIGTSNVAECCNELGIDRAIFVSTDKACSPISAYGMAKGFSEHLWVQSNNFGPTEFIALRYGNVRGSRGSLHEMWEGMRDQELSVTHPHMTRFFWEISEAAQFIEWALIYGERGVIYIPKMKGYKIMDIALEYSDKIKVVGLRTNEKLHEELISESEVQYATDQGERYAIYPVKHEWTIKLDRVGEALRYPIKSCDGMVSELCLKNEGCEP